jgi:hypothetical protein
VNLVFALDSRLFIGTSALLEARVDPAQLGRTTSSQNALIISPQVKKEEKNSLTNPMIAIMAPHGKSNLQLSSKESNPENLKLTPADVLSSVGQDPSKKAIINQALKGQAKVSRSSGGGGYALSHLPQAGRLSDGEARAGGQPRTLQEDSACRRTAAHTAGGQHVQEDSRAHSPGALTNARAHRHCQTNMQRPPHHAHARGRD